MMTPFKDHLLKLTARTALTEAEAFSCADAMLSGDLSEAQTAALLVALKSKGEVTDEISGFCLALKQHALKPSTGNTPLMDICGTGGDRLMSFNISTTVAFVLAGCGLKIAKHGNRSVSSLSGSADVLQHLGLNLYTSMETLSQQLAEIGLCFLFAPHVHPAMKQVMGVRKSLEIPTIFNLVGPLSNPLPLTHQIIGVYSEALLHPLAHCLKQLGIQRGAVVCGYGGMDELSLEGHNTVLMLQDNTLQKLTLHPDDVGLPAAPNTSHRCDSIGESAGKLLAVLKNKPGPNRDIVCFNAALALTVAGAAPDLKSGLAMAQKCLETGKALAVFEAMGQGA